MHRAEKLLASAGIANATVTAGDGYAGAADDGPYDRVIAWTTPHVVPAAWIAQTAADAVIVTPVKIAPLAAAHAVVTVTIQHGEPSTVKVHEGSYIEMTPVALTEQFGLPRIYVDAAHHDPGSEPWWLSSPSLRDPIAAAIDVLDHIRAHGRVAPTPLTADESRDDFIGWLYTTAGDDLATAGLGDHFIGVGQVRGDSAALLTTDGLFSAGTTASDALSTALSTWRDAGRPGWSSFIPAVTRTPDGWEVRLRLHDPGRP